MYKVSKTRLIYVVQNLGYLNIRKCLKRILLLLIRYHEFIQANWLFYCCLFIVHLKNYLIFQKPTDKCCTDYYIKHFNTINIHGVQVMLFLPHKHSMQTVHHRNLPEEVDS